MSSESGESSPSKTPRSADSSPLAPPTSLTSIFKDAAVQFRTERINIDKSVSDGGRLGSIIGTESYHASNIALIAISGLLVILFVSIIGLLSITVKTPESITKLEDVKSIILAILGLTGTILGYIFGKSVSASNNSNVSKP